MEQPTNYSRRDSIKIFGAMAEAARRLDASTLIGASRFLLPVTGAVIGMHPGKLPFYPGIASAEYRPPVIPNKKLDFQVIFPRVVADGWAKADYDTYPVLDFGPIGEVAEKAYPNYVAVYKEGEAADKYDQAMRSLGKNTNLRGLMYQFIDIAYNKVKQMGYGYDILSTLGLCYAHASAGIFFGDTLSENTVGGVHFTRKNLRDLVAMANMHIIERPVDIKAFHDGEPIISEVTRNFYFPVGGLSLDNKMVKVGYKGISPLSAQPQPTSSVVAFNSPQHPDHVLTNVKPEDNLNGGWSVESQMPLWTALVFARTPNASPKDFEAAFGGVF